MTANWAILICKMKHLPLACLLLFLAQTTYADDEAPWVTEENWAAERAGFLSRKAPAAKIKEKVPRSTPKPELEAEEADADPLPVASRQEVAEKEPTPAQKIDGSKFTIAPHLGFYSLSIRELISGENIGVKSDSSYGIGFSLAQSHSKRFRTAILASFDQRRFLPPIARTISESTQSLWSLGVEGGYRITPWLEGAGDLSAKHELFLRRIDASTVALDRPVVPQASLGINLALFEFAEIKLSAGARGHFFYERGPNNSPLQAKSGFGFSQSVALTRPMSKHYSLGLAYHHLSRDQSTKTTDQSEDQNQIFLRLTFSL